MSSSRGGFLSDTKRDLRDTLMQAWRCLRPGAGIIAMGPNIRYLPGKCWAFYDHHLALTESSLSEVMPETGFTIEERIPRFLPYTTSGNAERPVWMLRWYLSCHLPDHFLASNFWLLQGRNLPSHDRDSHNSSSFDVTSGHRSSSR
jgi:hypothetical protein